MININLIKDKIKVILKIALPMMTSFVAIGMMGIVDTIIVGNYDTNQLAYMGIANATFIILFTIPIALLQGVMIKGSQKFGARKFASTGKIYNEGKQYLVMLTAVFTIIGFFGEYILILLDQNETMVKEGGRILRVLSCSIPFILINVNDNFFLQSIKRPHIAMYSAVIANVLNIIINPMLVWGKFGLPELGAMGAAYTTLFLRMFLAIFASVYIFRMKHNNKLNKRFGLDRKYKTWWSDSKTTRKIGYGVACTTAATNGSFWILNSFAGWMGEQMMATYVVMNTVGGVLFMMFFSLSQATSIIVANDFGRKDREGIIVSTISGLIMLMGAMILFCSILAFFPKIIFGFFTDDPEVIALIVSLIAYIVFEIIVDSLPLSVVGALNGRGDVKIPTMNQIVSFLVIRLIFAYILAIRLDWGIKGLLIGAAISGISSLLLNSIRFIYLTRRDKLEGLR